jgi:hypothetical protein
VGDTLLDAVEVYEEGVKALVAMEATSQTREAPKAFALYHRVFAEEDFEDAAHALFDLVAYTQRTFPGTKRQLFLDIDGHRTPTGAFDEDMFELQRDFLLGYLLPFLAEVHMPLVRVENTNPQRDDLPGELHISPAP